MKKVITFSLMVILAGCSSLPEGYSTIGKPTSNKHCPNYSKVSSGYYGGDGSSIKEAIETVGIDSSSNNWVVQNYPNSKITSQELIIEPSSGLKYDLISFETSDGISKERWFWVSGGFQCF